MATIDTLLNTISGKSFAQLSAADQAVMATAFRPQGDTFDAEQYAMMANWYLVVPAARLEELQQLNQDRLHRATPTQLTDGAWVLPISLLTDCATASTNYAHLAPFLFGLKFRKVKESDWPVFEV